MLDAVMRIRGESHLETLDELNDCGVCFEYGSVVSLFDDFCLVVYIPYSAQQVMHVDIYYVVVMCRNIFSSSW